MIRGNRGQDCSELDMFCNRFSLESRPTSAHSLGDLSGVDLGPPFDEKGASASWREGALALDLSQCETFDAAQFPLAAGSRSVQNCSLSEGRLG